MKIDPRKFLSVGVLVLISTLAVNGAASKEAAIVKDVSFQNNGDFLEARITASENSKFTYFELKQPHRLVVDFHGSQNTISFKEKRLDTGGVERVRTSLFSDQNRQATRIVFDLTDGAPYRFIEDGGGIIRILFGEAVRAPQNQTAGPVMVPEPSTFSISNFGSPAAKLASILLLPEPVAAPLDPPHAPPVAPVAPAAPAPPAPAPTMSPVRRQPSSA
jgi:hypothetical protein